MDGEGDASEEKCAAARLADPGISLSLLEALLKTTDEGMMIFNTSGNVVALNERAHRLSGCPKEFRLVPEEAEHSAAALFELLSVDGLMLALDDWPMSRVLRGETVSRLHLRIRRLDTGESWIGVFNGTPVLNDQGQVVFGVLAMRDFSDRTETERALVDTNLRLTELLESIGDAFVSYDREWRYVYVNEQEAQLLGRPSQEVIGIDRKSVV